MTSQYRHRRSSNPATAFPNPLEPGEISVNTANRQLAVGDAAAGTVGSPLPLLAVRYFDVRAQYAVGSYVINAGILYRAKVAVSPAVFTPAQWDMIAGAVDPQYVEVAGDVMTGALSLPAAAPTAGVHATNKSYVDALVAAKSSVIVSNVKPTPDPIDSTLWYDSVGGQLYIRYNDGNTTQWVIASPQPDASQFDNRIAARAVLYDSAQALTDTQKVQARKNIYAAPVDALSYSGMQINGSMEVSQENGNAPIYTVPGSGISAYVLDGWIAGVGLSGGGQVAFAQQGLLATEVPGFTQCFQFTVTIAQASMGVEEVVRFDHPIEGYRFERVKWGTAAAMPVTVGFWVRAFLGGTYRAVMYNKDGTTVTPWMPFTIAGGAAFEWVTITFPARTTGTWSGGNDKGATLTVEMTSNATPNLLATTSGYASITGVVILPGIEAPAAERSGLIMRPFDQELVTCRRYLQMSPWLSGHFMEISASEAHFQLQFVPPMRSDPTIVPRAYAGAISRAGIGSYDISTISLYADGAGALIIVNTTIPAVMNVPANLWAGTFMLDARL